MAVPPPGLLAALREQHPAAVERNRQRQHVRDQKQRLRDLANNNSAFDLKHSSAEIWLLGAGLRNLATTTQFQRKSGFWKHFRRASPRLRNLANNNVLVSRRLNMVS